MGEKTSFYEILRTDTRNISTKNFADIDWNCLLSKLLLFANANIEFLEEQQSLNTRQVKDI